MEVAIANITSASRNHVITIIKTQTSNNRKMYEEKTDLVRGFIIAFTRIYHLLGTPVRDFSK